MDTAGAPVDAVAAAPPGAGAWLPVMNKSTFGKYRRVCFGAGSPPMVTKWIREQKITPPALRPDGKIDRAAADAQLAARLDPSRLAGRPAPLLPDLDEDDDLDPAPAPKGSSAYSIEQTGLASARRRKVELELAEREGLLVEAAGVEQAQFDAARRIRDRLMAIPQRVAPKLVGVADERTAAALVRDAITEILNETSDDLERGPGDSPGAGDGGRDAG